MNRGYSTLFVMVITLTLICGFLAGYRLILEASNLAEIKRRDQTLAQNILMSYDRHLFLNYGLLATDRSNLELLSKASFEQKKYVGLAHQLSQIKTITEQNELESQLRQIVLIRGGQSLVEYAEKKMLLKSKIQPLRGYLLQFKGIENKIDQGIEIKNKIEKLITQLEEIYDLIKSDKAESDDIERAKQLIERIKGLYELLKGKTTMDFLEPLETLEKNTIIEESFIILNNQQTKQVTHLGDLWNNPTEKTESKILKLFDMATPVMDGSKEKIDFDTLKEVSLLIIDFIDPNQFQNESILKPNVAQGSQEIDLPLNKIIGMEYVLGTFSDQVKSDAHETHFFKKTFHAQKYNGSEIEYIAFGNNNAQVNVKAVYAEIVSIRFGYRVQEILRDQAKMNQYLNKTQILAASFGGLPSGLILPALIAIDGYNSAKEDMITIMAGHKSDLFGLDIYYDDYLRLLVFLNNHDVVLNRILNVIKQNCVLDQTMTPDDQMLMTGFELQTYKEKNHLLGRVSDGYYQ